MNHNESTGLVQRRGHRGAATFQMLAALIGFFLGVGGACLVVTQNTPPSTADSKTERLESGPPNTTAALDTTAPLEAERQRLQSEVERARLEREVAHLRSELRDLQSTSSNARPRPNPLPPQSSTTSSFARPSSERRPHPTSDPGEATLQFWKSMNRIIRQEAMMRRAPMGGINQGNASSFLTSRMQAYSFAADQLGRLKRTHVDPMAIAVASDVRAWYLAGRDVSSRASSLMRSGASARQGSAGKSWQEDEKAHNAAVQGVNTRAENTRRALTSKYGLAFPPLE